jgi:hypothetical protein
MEESKYEQRYEISLSKQLRLYFSISLGLFLFILFYDPFYLIRFDNNDRLLFIAGLAGITFFFLSLFLIGLPKIIWGNFLNYNWTPFSDVLPQLFIWITSTVAFVFYLRYVGQVQMSMYLVFKIALLCLFPPIVIRLDNLIFFLKQQIKTLNDKIKRLNHQMLSSEVRLKQMETFISENKTEKLSLPLEDIIVIKSADNYVGIVFREGEEIKQKLIRNTLRNIEAQLMNYTDFVRCHRTCIINIKQVTNLSYSYKGYRLSVAGYNEDIPVSRQYVMKVKEVIASS